MHAWIGQLKAAHTKVDLLHTTQKGSKVQLKVSILGDKYGGNNSYPRGGNNSYCRGQELEWKAKLSHTKAGASPTPNLKPVLHAKASTTLRIIYSTFTSGQMKLDRFNYNHRSQVERNIDSYTPLCGGYLLVHMILYAVCVSHTLLIKQKKPVIIMHV